LLKLLLQVDVLTMTSPQMYKCKAEDEDKTRYHCFVQMQVEKLRNHDATSLLTSNYLMQKVYFTFLFVFCCNCDNIYCGRVVCFDFLNQVVYFLTK